MRIRDFLNISNTGIRDLSETSTKLITKAVDETFFLAEEVMKLDSLNNWTSSFVNTNNNHSTESALPLLLGTMYEKDDSELTKPTYRLCES